MNKLQKILTSILLLAVAALFFVSIMNAANRNIERFNASSNFQPSDFYEDKYEVTEVWEREITRANMSSFDQRYIFFKVKEQPFNFNFGEQFTDYAEYSENSKNILKYLKPGTVVSVSVNKEDLRYALDNSLLKQVFNFLSGSYNEVEVYKLSINGQTYFSQDITTPSHSNRNFADIAIGRNLLRFGFVCSIIYALIYWIPKMAKKLKSKK